MLSHRAARISTVFAVQLLNSMVHHSTHVKPFLASISVVDVACTLTLVVSLVYLGYVASQPPRYLLSGALWSLLLWVFGVGASLSVMRLLDPARIDASALAAACAATLILAPVALVLGALGAWRVGPQVVA